MQHGIGKNRQIIHRQEIYYPIDRQPAIHPSNPVAANRPKSPSKNFFSASTPHFFILHSTFFIPLKTVLKPSIISLLRRGARESAAAQEISNAISSLVSMY